MRTIKTLICIALTIALGIVCYMAYQSLHTEYIDPVFDDLESFDYTTLQFQENTYNPVKIKYLVVHCTGNPMKYPYTKTTLNNFFFNDLGWSKPGYRHFVDVYGAVWDLIEYFDFDEYLDYREITYGARGYNKMSIHISYDGGYKGIDTRKDAQKQALARLVKFYKNIYPDISVIPHYTLNSNKACPSFDAYTEYASIAEMSSFMTLTPDYLD